MSDAKPDLQASLGANKYDGEVVIPLYIKKYKMKINMGVIAKFQSETGEDYMHCAIKAMNALRKCIELDPMEQAELMTKAVSMENAAWLFYLCAKECDSQVTFEEIQEAVLYEGPLAKFRIDSNNEQVVVESYPVLFANLCMFATLGVVDIAKKQH